MPYIHGATLLEVDSGARPIQTANSSVIGVVGTAPDADAAAFPLNTPVLIAGSLSEAAKLDTVGDGNGTLPAALNGIFDQIGAAVVVVRVDEGADAAATTTNVIGGVNGTTGDYEGIKALLGAKSKVGVQPRILIAPGFSQEAAVVTELVSVADSLRGFVYADGPNLLDNDATAHVATIGSKRCMVIDPWVKVFAGGVEVVEPASARVAGLRAKIDNEKGFWHSVSNHTINGVIGVARPVDFAMGDSASRANVLNEQHVTTIIVEGGYRVWGVRTTEMTDPKWAFESVVRTADMINDAILQNHLWAIDRNLTKTYFDDVIAGVQNYLRTLVGLGAIAGGDCWADPELNTTTNMAAGQAYFDFDFVSYSPAEQVTFRSAINNNYLTEVLGG